MITLKGQFKIHWQWHQKNHLPVMTLNTLSSNFFNLLWLTFVEKLVHLCRCRCGGRVCHHRVGGGRGGGVGGAEGRGRGEAAVTQTCVRVGVSALRLWLHLLFSTWHVPHGGGQAPRHRAATLHTDHRLERARMMVRVLQFWHWYNINKHKNCRMHRFLVFSIYVESTTLKHSYKQSLSSRLQV